MTPSKDQQGGMVCVEHEPGTDPLVCGRYEISSIRSTSSQYVTQGFLRECVKVCQRTYLNKLDPDTLRV